jgi:exodeoxyribonuclease VII small subunit
LAEPTSTTSSPAGFPAAPSFEQALASLEEIVLDLEAGRLGLADSLARYEEAVKLLKQCYMQLEQAERRVELLTGLDAAGNPITTPFDDSATLVPDTTDVAPRSRRGGKPKRPAETVDPGAASNLSAMDEPGSLF